MSFNKLCKILGLDSLITDEEKLNVLEKWYLENVSTDQYILGDAKAKYHHYCKLTETYLHHFLPNFSKNLTDRIQAFGKKNAIQEAAFQGLDKFLTLQKPEIGLLNQSNNQLQTPLHYAVINGYYHTVETLLLQGASPEIPNNQNQLPIFSVLLLPVIYNDNKKENKEKIFRLLRDKAPKTLNHQNASGDTVLHMMAVYNFPSLMQEVLKTNNELTYIKNNRSRYPIHTAILHKRMECLDILLKQKGASLLQDSQNRVALHYAVLYASRGILALCIESAKNLDPRDAFGKTPLILAGEAGNFDAVKTLVEAGADITVKDNKKCTVLHYAVKSGNLNLVEWLLNQDIKINEIDDDLCTPLDIANTLSEKKISELLSNHGAISKNNNENNIHSYK
ncbi:Ankyrin repeat protein [Legionella santicrucis]|uniref:Ankyrin repeat protein n=1 Tax=Legionella santicrucis TaxID=45074 RepID=A0A0W0YD37_9GAMM|nr:ankyrin repeat domain-containing protein [Legionella santicrucis]KTD54674.1 Ankyrin repeat protein [Legionella santicrucis]